MCSQQVQRQFCGRRDLTSSAWSACESSALSSTTSWRLLTTSPLCCRRVPACCSPCWCCVRHTTYFAPQSSRGSSTRRQHGRGCVRLPTERILILCCDAPNGWDTAATTSQPSPTCSTSPTMIFHLVITNSYHVLQPYLPHRTDIPYQLRARPHSMTLINVTRFLTTMTFLSVCYTNIRIDSTQTTVN